MISNPDDELASSHANIPLENTSERVAPSDYSEREIVGTHNYRHTGRKSFREYLLEGLMIFVAVSMGFIAENIRENTADNEREQTYMKSLVEDLQFDTLMYSKSRENLAQDLLMFDSLIDILSSYKKEKNTNKASYYARLITVKFDKLIFREGTYDQMKSSGDRRLIQHRNVADSISDYYNSIKIISSQNIITDHRANLYISLANKIFDAKTMLQIFKDRKEPTNAKLLVDDHQVINEFLMATQYYYGSLHLLAKWGSERNEKAKRLLTLINKEYHKKKE